MPPVQWSKTPETPVRAGSKAPFTGVLLPEENYRNYKSFEQMQPVYDKLVKAGDLPVCSEPGVLSSPFFWGSIGIIAGAIAEASAHR